MTPVIFRSMVQMLILVLIAPGVLGTLRWMKARFQGRQGPRITQVYLDVWKLFLKRAVVPEGSSWVFISAPIIIFLFYCCLAYVTPVVYLPSGEEIRSSTNGIPFSDLLVVVYLLGFTHFIYALAGMDTGAPFGGLGSSREMFLNFITEPALIVAVYALAINVHTTNLPAIMSACAAMDFSMFYGNPSIWLVFITLGLITFAETGRIPFDNQATHLELTMLGKAIALEYSGPFLALLEWAESIRLTFFITVMLNLMFPIALSRSSETFHLLLSGGFYLIRILLVVLLIAIWEMTRVKLRLRAIINPGVFALAFAIMAIFVAVARIYFV